MKNTIKSGLAICFTLLYLWTVGAWTLSVVGEASSDYPTLSLYSTDIDGELLTGVLPNELKGSLIKKGADEEGKSKTGFTTYLKSQFPVSCPILPNKIEDTRAIIMARIRLILFPFHHFG